MKKMNLIFVVSSLAAFLSACSIIDNYDEALMADEVSSSSEVVESSSSVVESSSSIESSSSSGMKITSKILDSRDGQEYDVVKIGENYWFKENLNYNADGSMCYDDDTTYCAIYGRLYLGTSISDNLCPEGTHVSSEEDWTAIKEYLNEFGRDTIAVYLKATTGWNESTEALTPTNKTGFTALPAGAYDASDGYEGVGNATYFWTSTSDHFEYHKSLYMRYNTDFLSDLMEVYDEDKGFSVRCVLNRE